jgi:hypothetical protein
MKELSKKAKHNAWVKEQRRLGNLPNFDGTYNKPPKVKPPKKRIKLKIDFRKKWKKEATLQYKKIKLSESGSILNNKYSYFRYPFDKVTNRDF